MYRSYENIMKYLFKQAKFQIFYSEGKDKTEYAFTRTYITKILVVIIGFVNYIQLSGTS